MMTQMITESKKKCLQKKKKKKKKLITSLTRLNFTLNIISLHITS